MADELYAVIGNRTAQDVVDGNDVVIARGLEDLEEAKRIAICAQRYEGFTAAWIEIDSPSRTFKQQQETEQ